MVAVRKKIHFIFPLMGIFLVWRSILFLVGYFANTFLAYDPSFPYSIGLLDTFGLPQWLYSWANFDGVHYITITRDGYGSASYMQAFFPIYPYFSSLLNKSIDNILLANLALSNLSFAALLITWYYFVKESFSKKRAFIATIILLVFPTSLFFGAAYTESFFLLMVILSFIATQKKKYMLTALFVALASATRIVGIFLIPALFFEILFEGYTWNKMQHLVLKKKNYFVLWAQKRISKHALPLATVALGSLGLLTYMYYLATEFGDPLYFFHVQAEFGGIREEVVVTYPQVLYRYLKILVTARPFDFKYYSYLQDFIAGTVGLGLLVYSATKVRLSYVIFSLLVFIAPTLTGTFSSLPRYILVCFPLFIVLADWTEKNRLFRYTWFIFSGILLVLNTVLFIHGYWVA